MDLDGLRVISGDGLRVIPWTKARPQGIPFHKSLEIPDTPLYPPISLRIHINPRKFPDIPLHPLLIPRHRSKIIRWQFSYFFGAAGKNFANSGRPWIQNSFYGKKSHGKSGINLKERGINLKSGRLKRKAKKAEFWWRQNAEADPSLIPPTDTYTNPLDPKISCANSATFLRCKQWDFFHFQRRRRKFCGFWKAKEPKTFPLCNKISWKMSGFGSGFQKFPGSGFGSKKSPGFGFRVTRDIPDRWWISRKGSCLLKVQKFILQLSEPSQ